MSLKNEYFTVLAPFMVYVRRGETRPSNVWIGASQALDWVYEETWAQPGEEIHSLVGGNFLIRDGVALEFDMRKREAFDVMLHPGPSQPALPADKLRPQPSPRQVAYRPELAREEAQA